MPKIQPLESLSKEQLIEIIQQERQAADSQPSLRKDLNPTTQLAFMGNGDPELINYERPRLCIAIDTTKSLEERLKEYVDANYPPVTFRAPPASETIKE